MINIYNKYKEIILYIFYGALTTVISILTFFIFNSLLNINELIANIISWIFAVTFAYITNRIRVFNSNAKGINILKEATSFYVGRASTLLIEELIIYIFVTCLSFNSLLIKVLCQFIVLVMNYIISKIIIFRKKEK